ncbi:MAG: DUF1016 family protein, partial [Saprospiraceae bacterium]|nr:DUF1016 family protein [Saprospiraceae bacterium]
AARTINQYLTIRNWLIGYYLVEYEQNGEDRAKYGDKIIDSVTEKLNPIKGIDRRALFRFRQFYLYYPHLSEYIHNVLRIEDQRFIKVGTPSPQFDIEKVGTVSPQLNDTYKVPAEKLFSHLSYSHIELLISIENPLKRAYYEIECIKGVWSVRELKRQINSLSYERSMAADNPGLMTSELSNDAETLSTTGLIKSPYVFDFLNLPDGVLGSESELEAALINDLKSFILELGHGFCFEAQQKRIVIGGEYYFIDLVFYHRILKCHVLIELKIEEFTHGNIGQLNTYLQYYRHNIQENTDNPPVGILLCTNKNDELVEYALGGMDEKLFVSQYQTVLPSSEQLEQFLKEEKDKLIE